MLSFYAVVNKGVNVTSKMGKIASQQKAVTRATAVHRPVGKRIWKESSSSAIPIDFFKGS